MPDILHFARQLTDVDMDQILGPDVARRYLGIKSVELTDDGTTIALNAILPADYTERFGPTIAMQAERERIRAVFHGA